MTQPLTPQRALGESTGASHVEQLHATASSLRQTRTEPTAFGTRHGWQYHLLPGQDCLQQLRQISHLLRTANARGKPRYRLEASSTTRSGHRGAKLRRSSGRSTVPSVSRNPFEQSKILQFAKALGVQLELGEQPTIARAGFPASRRHRSNTPIGDQLKHCTTVLGATRPIPLKTSTRERKGRKSSQTHRMLNASCLNDVPVLERSNYSQGSGCWNQVNVRP